LLNLGSSGIPFSVDANGKSLSADGELSGVKVLRWDYDLKVEGDANGVDIG